MGEGRDGRCMCGVHWIGCLNMLIMREDDDESVVKYCKYNKFLVAKIESKFCYENNFNKYS